MYATPSKELVITPDVEPISAIVISVLDQIPPGVAFDKVIDDPLHTVVVPVIIAGIGFTVIVVAA